MTRNTNTHWVGQFLLSKLGTKTRTRTRSGSRQANRLELELEHNFTAWTRTTLTDDSIGHSAKGFSNVSKKD